MKITRKIIAISLSLLLVSGNMAFAQTKRSPKGELKTQISRAAAKAAQQEERSIQLMNEIINKAIKAEKSRGTNGICTAAGTFLAIIGGCVLSCLDLPLGSIVVAYGAMSARDMIEEKEYAGVLHQTGTRDYSFHEDYVEIQKSLGEDVLARFSIVIKNPAPNFMTKGVKESLKQFAAHPRRKYVAKRLQNGEYRFYFIPRRTDVYVDINAEDRIIYVKGDSVPQRSQYTPIAIIGPKYVYI